MATDLGTQITALPGQYLATLTNADKGYAFTYPTGLRVRVSVQPHDNGASVSLTQSAITDGTTDVVASDQMIVAANGVLSWVAGDADRESATTLATQFVLTSGTAGTKVLIWLEEID